MSLGTDQTRPNMALMRSRFGSPGPSSLLRGPKKNSLLASDEKFGRSLRLRFFGWPLPLIRKKFSHFTVHSSLNGVKSGERRELMFIARAESIGPLPFTS